MIELSTYSNFYYLQCSSGCSARRKVIQSYFKKNSWERIEMPFQIVHHYYVDDLSTLVIIDNGNC